MVEKYQPSEQEIADAEATIKTPENWKLEEGTLSRERRFQMLQNIEGVRGSVESPKLTIGDVGLILRNRLEAAVMSQVSGRGKNGFLWSNKFGEFSSRLLLRPIEAPEEEIYNLFRMLKNYILNTDLEKEDKIIVFESFRRDFNNVLHSAQIERENLTQEMSERDKKAHTHFEGVSSNFNQARQFYDKVLEDVKKELESEVK